jgi:hypothetical protein
MNRHLLLALLPLAACGFLETGGNSKSGRFEAALPPAVVARTSYDLEILDYELGTSVPTTVSAASSGADSIAAATATEDGIVSLEVKQSGSFSLDFTAQADGKEQMDSFELISIDAARLELEHLCDARYVANHPADVEFWFSDGARRRGNGYGWYPVTVADATLDEAASTAHTLRIGLGDRNATVTSSHAPSNEEPAQLVLDVVPISAVDGIAFVDEHDSPVFNGRRLDKGDEQAIRVVPALGSVGLCGARVEAEVEVSEDSDCMLALERGSDDLERSLTTNGELIVVVVVAYGVCELTATLLDVAAGGVLDLDVSEPQRSGGGDFD